MKLRSLLGCRRCGRRDFRVGPRIGRRPWRGRGLRSRPRGDGATALASPASIAPRRAARARARRRRAAPASAFWLLTRMSAQSSGSLPAMRVKSRKPPAASANAAGGRGREARGVGEGERVRQVAHPRHLGVVRAGSRSTTRAPSAGPEARARARCACGGGRRRRASPRRPRPRRDPRARARSPVSWLPAIGCAPT